MNHNLETVPRLYKQARPGADYAHSLKLLKDFKARFPHVPTKSGLMVGLGETDEEILAVMRDLRAHDVDMLTIGQYLQPSGAPPAGAALCRAGDIRHVRARSAAHGLQPRRQRAAGALVVSRRPAGARRRHGLIRRSGSRVFPPSACAVGEVRLTERYRHTLFPRLSNRKVVGVSSTSPKGLRQLAQRIQRHRERQRVLLDVSQHVVGRVVAHRHGDGFEALRAVLVRR